MTENALAEEGLEDAWWRPPRSEATNCGSKAITPETGESQLPFRGLMAFTIILLLAPQFIFTFLEPFRIALLAILVTVISLIYTRISRGQPILNLSEGAVYPLLIAGWATITVPMSFWPGGSISFLTGIYFKPLVLFILLANIVNTRGKLTRIAWLLSLVAVPLSLTTLKHFLTGELSQGDRVVGYKGGLTSNPNDLALMLNLILPFCIALFFAYRNPLIRWLQASIMVLIVTAVIVTFSRAGFLALAVMFLVYFWRLRNRPERRYIPFLLMLAVMALPLVPRSYYERVSTITDVSADTTGSAQIRLRDSIAAAGYVAGHPLMGAGIGMNALAMNSVRGETWTEVHNVYLQFAVELGIPGLLLFLAFYRCCFNNTRQVLEGSEQHGLDEYFYITEAIRIGLIVYAVEAFFHPSAYQFYFYYISGLAVATKAIFVSESRQQHVGS